MTKLNDQLFKDIKRQVIKENLYRKKVGPIQTYNLVLDLCDYDSILADAFMLSDFGGYTRGQLNFIKYKKTYKKQYDKQKLNTGLQAF